MRVPTLMAAICATALISCGDDPSKEGGANNGGANNGGADNGGANNGGANNGGNNTVVVASGCEAVPRADVAGATEVSDEAGLRAALTAGGTILLTADILATAPFEVGNDTVVDGGGFAIDAGDSTHLFVSTRTNFTIQNITLRGANNRVSDDEHFSRRSGAALMANGGSSTEGPGVGSLTVIDVVFEDNIIKPNGPGDLRGGALYGFRMPDITVSGSTFRNNVGSNGGAIGGLGSSFRIVNTVFENNRTSGEGPSGSLEGHGGAISLDALTQNGVTAYLDICGSSFVDNQAKYGGGAFYLVTHGLTGTTVSVERSLFSGNHSTSGEEGQGGAIFLMDDDKNGGGGPNNAASFRDCLFVGNETFARGGGLWYWTVDGRLTVTNTTFVDNRTTQSDTGMGGAVAISRGPADFVHCTFANNYAKFHGGGIQMGGEADVSLLNSLFYENTSNRDGGWANFHTNRAVDRDLGGNMQFLSESLVIDSNSDKPVADGVVFADPLLEPLSDNGGPTMTMALGPGSPAIDAGVSGGVAEDQRGEPRGGKPDIGAFEVQ